MWVYRAKGNRSTMTDDNSSFLREVEQEVRRDRMMRLADRYGIPILVVVGVLLVGGLFYYLYQASARENAERAGNAFIVAERLARAGKTDEARKDFERLANEGSGVYVALAHLRLAGIALAASKPKEAKTHFDAVANDTTVDEKLRTHAALQSIAVDIDTLDWTTAKNRLSSFMDDASSWRHSARELLALVAFREKKFADAKQVLAGLISDQNAPQAIRQRAQVLMGLTTAAERAAASPDPASRSDASPAGDKKANAAGPGESGPAKAEADGTKPTAAPTQDKKEPAD